MPYADHTSERVSLQDVQDAQAALCARGGVKSKRQGQELHSPCPLCGGKDRLWSGPGDVQDVLLQCRVCEAPVRELLVGLGLRESERRAGVGRRPPAKSGPAQRPRPPAKTQGKRQANGGNRLHEAAGRQAAAKAAKLAAAEAAWRAARPCARAPGEAYLRVRGVHPKVVAAGDKSQFGWRWLAAGDIDPAWGLGRLPPNAAGCLLYRFDSALTGRLQAVQLEALTAAGERCEPRWRRTLGAIAGCVHMQGASKYGGEGRPLHVCEGPIDAIAIALRLRVEAWALGGSSANEDVVEALAGQAARGRLIVIHVDGAAPGKRPGKGLDGLYAALFAKGCRVRMRRWPPGKDPGDGLLDPALFARLNLRPPPVEAAQAPVDPAQAPVEAAQATPPAPPAPVLAGGEANPAGEANPYNPGGWHRVKPDRRMANRLLALDGDVAWRRRAQPFASSPTEETRT